MASFARIISGGLIVKSRSTYTQTIIFFSRPFNTTRLYCDFILDKQFGCFNRVVAPWVYLAWYNITLLFRDIEKLFAVLRAHDMRTHTYLRTGRHVYMQMFSQASSQSTFFALYFDAYSASDVYSSLNLQKRPCSNRPIRDHTNRVGFEVYAISLLIILFQSHFVRFNKTICSLFLIVSTLND